MLTVCRRRVCSRRHAIWLPRSGRQGIARRLNLEPKAVVLDLNARLYQLADGTVRSIPDGIRVKVVDTTATEIVEGKHAFTFQPAGVTECDSIILWNDKKSIRMQIDPVVGTVETKVAGN